MNTIIISRCSSEETTFAIVKYELSGDGDDRLFFGKLGLALAQWMTETEDGRIAWNNSSEDFNIGDLSNYYKIESLQPYLSRVGITMLEIEIITDSDPCYFWTYDTVLGGPFDVD